MLTFWSSKGGVGCSTVAAAVALLASAEEAAAASPGVLLVDLDGDLPSVLGIGSPPLGIADWLAEPLAAPDSLSRIEINVAPGLHLLPLGSLPRLASANRLAPSESQPNKLNLSEPRVGDRSRILFKLLASESRLVIVDVGRRTPESFGSHRAELKELASAYSTNSVLVTRLCHLSLRQVTAFEKPNRVVVVAEPGRTLRLKDVAKVVGAPVEATVRWEPAVGRAVDAGLSASRVPRALRVVSSLPSKGRL